MSVVRFARAAWRRPRRASAWAGLLATAFLLVAVTSSIASHISGVDGHTTLEQIVTGDKPGRCGTGASAPSCGYFELRSEAVSGSRFPPRDGTSEGNAFPTAQSGRENRRQSLAYFGQLTDFQLADEETPAKVEFLDGAQNRSTPGASSAWRPQEAFQGFIVDQSIRQMNLFAGASPVDQGNGNPAAMDFALMTGDQADSAQRNETIWVRELLEGGEPLDFNSGIQHNTNYSVEHPSCASYTPNAIEAAKYTGVQDYDDYDESQTPNYYDPDQVTGFWANPDGNALTNDSWPTYAGLMDRAQQLTITPEGSAVPTYVTNGNHDPLVQGNEDAIKSFEDIAMGCFKALTTTATPGPGILSPSTLLSPGAFMLVPPDPMRRYVSKPQIRAIYGEDGEDNAHGFGFVDIDELRASCPVALQVQCNQSDATARKHGSASYYAWDPPETPGFRFISIDTVSEGGQTAEGVGCGSAAGNIDDPQWQWLTDELDAASAQQKLIVIFGHHPVRSLCTEVRDEQASQCTTDRTHGDDPEHDQNPGCDIDPRPSDPIHLGCDPMPDPPSGPAPPEFTCDPDRNDPRVSFVELLENYPHVISYVAGHTHDNKVLPCGTPVNDNGTPQANDDFGGCTEGGNWWEINTAATSDWPVQHRLVEVMDNHDGTLSIFGTILDHRAAGEAPAPGSAAGFTNEQLAAIGNEFAYNDPQAGNNTGEGVAEDQNVELLIDDPRTADLALTKTDSPDPVSVGGLLTYTLQVSNSGAATNGVTLTDALPKNVRFQSASSSRGRCALARPRTVTCNLTEIGNGETVTVTIKVRPTRSGSIINTATVQAGWPPDPVLVNNAASAPTQVNP